ncbi:Transcriptional regulator WhiB [Mycobacterium marinum]|nr:Transcriptional regulator WhiB [Mycobacterium marinum]
MTAPGWVDLCAAILRGTPKLPGALCAGRAELFDGDTDEAATRAMLLCRHCPARDPCGDWADQLRYNQAHGVLAGQHREWVSHPSQLKTTTKGTQ